MEALAHLFIGFSAIAGAVLLASYAFFLKSLHRSARSLTTCALLLTGLVQLQLGHAEFLADGTDLLVSSSYRLWLFLTPPMFYLFGRSILFDEGGVSPVMLLHLLPVALSFLLRIEVAISVLFCIGTGYSLWLTHVIYRLSATRRRSRFELFFLGLFSVLAVGVLLLGFALPYIEPGYFYYFYTFAIGIAFALVVGALVSFPELLTEFAEVARASYASTTLNNVDIEDRKAHLSRLMNEEKIYQDETLTLAALADAMDLSSHQLSELINTQFGVSFSRYVREQRVAASIALLRAEPEASVLSISMEVGFKSQSNFYAAFKDITGQSPSAYRG